MAFISGEIINLRALCIDDANSDYLQWMNDYDVVKYTESRFYPCTIEALKNYIINANNSNNISFAIVDKKNQKHVGNIKIGNINWIHRYCDIGLIIGEKDYWGKGIATEAILLATRYAFEVLNLRKVYAGIYEPNIGSLKAFIKAGYNQISTHKDKYYFEGKYINSIEVECRNEGIK